MSLTDQDRIVIARARALAAPVGVATVAPLVGYGPDADSSLVYAAAFGTAQPLLDELANIAERLAGAPGDPQDTATCPWCSR